MKRTIIAIVGPSGCGKTTLANYLCQHHNIPTIISYTTRPMRPGEQDGVEHLFVTEEQMPSKDVMLAYTQFGGHHYWANKAQVPQYRPCTYIIDERALVEMQRKFQLEFRIIPIYIRRDVKNLIDIDEERQKRDEERVRLADHFYSAIIVNNGSLEDFFKNATHIIKSFL
ncbi:MAG: guanylate kinase [Bacteroidales bacterium]|nr:guanylate kinase [Bacteroidales bacterium]